MLKDDTCECSHPNTTGKKDLKKGLQIKQLINVGRNKIIDQLKEEVQLSKVQ